MPLVTKSLIDGATSGNSSALWKYGLMLVLVMCLERFLTILVSRSRLKASVKIQRGLQSNITNAILGKDYGSLKAFHSGELVSRVFSDAEVVKNGMVNLAPSLLRTFVSFVGASIIMITMDWRFLPFIILAGIVGAIMTILFHDPMKRRHKRMQEAEARLHAGTQEVLENIHILKASLSEERTAADLEEQRQQLMDEQTRNGSLSIFLNNGMGSMFDLTWMICYLWGCMNIFHGTFTYGSLAAMIQLAGRIQSPIANMVSLVSQIYGVIASAERLQDVLKLPDEEEGEHLDSFDAISMEHVSFQYDDGLEDVLLDASFTIRRGEFVALTGASGGGKTSLFQLLLGIYHPQKGRVFFQQNEKRVPACKATRKLFAYVPQGNRLFSGSLRDNLTRFTDKTTDDKIQSAVHAACLDELVEKIGMDVRLGERGIGLSEGQAQRVAVARALLSEAPILLLDEATSALDEKTEEQMLRNIAAMRDKTVVIVTHRRAAIRFCDYTLHLEKGSISRMENAENQIQ